MTDRQRILRESYRLRRLMACRAVGILEDVLSEIPDGPYSQVSEHIDGGEAAVEGLPGLGRGQREELVDLARTLLRMILKANDGGVSSDTLRRY